MSDRIELGIFLEGDGALDDWMSAKPTPKVRHINQGLRVLRLRNGTDKGHNVISICARSPSGQVIVLEMTERLFLIAARAVWQRSSLDGTLAPDIVEDGGDIQLSDEAVAAMTPEQLRLFQAMLDRQQDQVIAAQLRAKGGAR